MTNITDVLDKQIIEACKQLGFTLQILDNPEITTMAKSMAYEPYEYGNIYEDGTQGLLVRLSPEHDTYNNGVYMLHKAKANTQTEEEQYLYQLEVVIPNTKSKDSLITHLVGEITTFIENLDTSDLEVFDFAEIYGFVLANTVVKHLAVSLYPDDYNNQVVFTNLYMPRFLAHIAQLYAGVGDIQEQAVNSDPYLYKLAIDGLDTDEIKFDKNDNIVSESNKILETGEDNV